MTASSEPPTLLLVGAGNMAVAYSRVLAHLERHYRVLGRGAESAAAFAEATGVPAGTGRLETQLGQFDGIPDTAIVTVNAMYLAEVTTELVGAGVRRLLVEKPAALDGDEMDALVQLVEATGADIRIGYNRRFMASVVEARRMIADDGGVLSVKFDFSEPARRIATLGKPQRELDTWFYGNSAHVIDLAFHFAGDCTDVSGAITGSVPWHPAAGVFAGHAVADSGALLSWHANWMGPGRWGIEVVTPERRLILQPLERLRYQDHDSFAEHDVELDLGVDEEFKPGLLRQVAAFLDGDDDAVLADVSEQARRWPMYEAVRTGGAFGPNGSRR